MSGDGIVDIGCGSAQPWDLRFFLAFLILAGPVCAQSDTAPPADGPEPFWSRFWVSAQANFIRQQHPTFDAQYSGTEQLPRPTASTPHRGWRRSTPDSGLPKRLEILADIESAGGAGLSNALGIAGFTNVDVVRNPTLSEAPYVARVMLHYTIPFGKETTEATRNPLSLASAVPVRRLELRAGKMSTVDFFDLNSVGSDSHLQFMNWAAVNNGAFDYAADTRGYTYGLVAEYYAENWAARFGEMLMPTIANGITLDWNIARARGENYELEYHPTFLPKRASVVRALAFVNHANMGSYREAIDGYLSGKDAVPDITIYRRQGRVKYGFGLNAEQELTPLWRGFFRLGWNDGHTESFAYTEIDRTAEVGSDFRGTPWRRSQDKIGVGVSRQRNLRRPSTVSGAGRAWVLFWATARLNYGLEKIFETYYTAHVWRGISVAFDYQHVTNPGYNRDRGPASVVSFRVHIEDAVPFDKLGSGN